MSNAQPIGLGTRLWKFDHNRRVYPATLEGEIYAKGGPIYSEHFVAFDVVGQTRASWIVGTARYPNAPTTKINRKTLYCTDRFGTTRYYTDAQKADAIWINENRHALCESVRGCADVEKLKRIAAILDERPTPSGATP